MAWHSRHGLSPNLPRHTTMLSNRSTRTVSDPGSHGRTIRRPPPPYRWTVGPYGSTGLLRFVSGQMPLRHPLMTDLVKAARMSAWRLALRPTVGRRWSAAADTRPASARTPAPHRPQ
jgi:hypothetical protein